MPSFPDLQERLSDGGLELRLAKEWDIPDILIAHQDDPQLYRRIGQEQPPSGAELGRCSEDQPAERAAGIAVRLTVVLPGDDTCRGQLDVHEVDWVRRQAELGIWLAPALRGQGLAPRALRLAAGWLLGPCGLERLSLITQADNLPMLHAARAAGFVEHERSSDTVSMLLSA